MLRESSQGFRGGGIYLPEKEKRVKFNKCEVVTCMCRRGKMLWHIPLLFCWFGTSVFGLHCIPFLVYLLCLVLFLSCFPWSAPQKGGAMRNFFIDLLIYPFINIITTFHDLYRGMVLFRRGSQRASLI